MLKTISIRNGDMADLFVWVRDLNTSDQRIVLDGERINSDERLNIAVEFDSDNEARVTWLAKSTEENGDEKEGDVVDLNEGEELVVDVFGARTLTSNDLYHENFNAFSYIPWRVQDPGAATMLAPLLGKIFASLPVEVAPQLEYIEQIKIEWGDAIADTERSTSVPSVIEESILVYTNDTDQPKPHEELIKVTTKRSVSYDTTQRIESTNEYKIGITVPIGAGSKINGDLLQKNTVTIGASATQRFDEEKLIETKEKWEIPARSRHFLRTVVTKGLLITPIKGRVVLDALIVVSIKPGGTLGDRRVNSNPVWLSHPKGLPNPADRVINYEGTLTSEGYQKIEIDHRDDLLEQSSNSINLFEPGGWHSSGNTTF